jgi:hypothetical protein
MSRRLLTRAETALIADDLDRLQRENDRLNNRVAVLEMVIRQEFYPSDCNDEANAMIVEEIIERMSPALPSDQ